MTTTKMMTPWSRRDALRDAEVALAKTPPTEIPEGWRWDPKAKLGAHKRPGLVREFNGVTVGVCMSFTMARGRCPMVTAVAVVAGGLPWFEGARRPAPKQLKDSARGPVDDGPQHVTEQGLHVSLRSLTHAYKLAARAVEKYMERWQEATATDREHERRKQAVLDSLGEIPRAVDAEVLSGVVRIQLRPMDPVRARRVMAALREALAEGGA